MSYPEYFDDLETRSSDEREAGLFQSIARHLENAKTSAPYFKQLYKDIDPASVTDRKSLSALPLTRKSDLINLQKQDMPLGGLTTCKAGKLKRIFQSPGPIYDPEGYGRDWWRTARALYAAGFRAGDIVHNTFAYHFTPAGIMMETGAAEIGCAVFPAGVGQTELQVRAIADIRPQAYAGTPSFLKIILEKAEALGSDTTSLKKAIVGGEALFPDLRRSIENYGVNCQQIYASADIGNLAYESSAKDGLIVEESLLIEIVRPGTGEPVEDGEVGEVVATRLTPEYPLIRFATGDLSAVMPGTSPCGRTNMRLKGWMGRADQTTKVKGMFVHPQQIADIVKRHPEILKARMTVDHQDGSDIMTLACEVENIDSVAGGPDPLSAEIMTSIQAVCKLKGQVGFAKPGTLPNDGKVIDDIRSFD